MEGGGAHAVAVAMQWVAGSGVVGRLGWRELNLYKGKIINIFQYLPKNVK